LKSINDRHGHLFGAYVIGEVGRLIGRTLDGSGIAARFGGDEFVAAVPGLDLEGTRELAERIRATVEDHPFEHEGIVLAPGISIGIASFPQSGQSATALFQCADAALYRAKHAGKGRVCD
ncbi:MAG: GGDEF domain-containing protein, partial [Polyangiales bacterium]